MCNVASSDTSVAKKNTPGGVKRCPSRDSPGGLHKWTRRTVSIFIIFHHAIFFCDFQKFYDFEDTMNQQYQPPPPVSQPPTTASPTTSSSDLMMGPPPPHLYPLPTSECWPPPPVGPPVTSEPNESNSGVPPLCAGCRLRIEDKFYLSAVDVKWHSACLKCAECGVELETQSSCFEKDGHIYCKDDYRRYLSNWATFSMIFVKSYSNTLYIFRSIQISRWFLL